MRSQLSSQLQQLSATAVQENLAQMSASPLEMILAETAQQTHTAHSCSFQQDRAKEPLVDFYSILAAGEPFTDTSFTMEDAYYLAEDFAGVRLRRNQYHKFYVNQEWRRAFDVLPNATLFGKDGIGPQDAVMGSVSSSWLMSAASSIAEVPSRLDAVILNEDNALNPAGIYAFEIRTLGFPHTVIVDDYLPMKWDDDY